MTAATFLTITNATTNTLAMEGDNGSPRIIIPATAGANTENVYLSDVMGNVSFCDLMSDWITSGWITVVRGSVTITAADALLFKTGGDMYEDTYDTDEDKLVDVAEGADYEDFTTVATAASPYTILATDRMIVTNTTAGNLTLNLPAANAANMGRAIYVYDGTGTWDATHACILDAAGTDTIDGGGAGGTLTMTVAKGFIKIWNNGAGKWFTDHFETRALQTVLGTTAFGKASVAINLKAVAETSAALNGTAGQFFLPTGIKVRCNAQAGALNANAQITVGITTPGGTEILPATVLAGMNTLGDLFCVPLAGDFITIPGNATIYVNVTSADTGAGTGTAVVYLEGTLV